MKVKIVTAAAIALAFISNPAAAAKAASGNEWVGYCKAGSPTCWTYARGVADGLAVWEMISPETATACIPQAVDAAQLRDIGLQFIKDNPKDRHVPAGLLLAKAFMTTWPCSSNGKVS